jgi:parvulin-like peptidyl-prolyl isomerase
MPLQITVNDHKIPGSLVSEYLAGASGSGILPVQQIQPVDENHPAIRQLIERELLWQFFCTEQGLSLEEYPSHSSAIDQFQNDFEQFVDQKITPESPPSVRECSQFYQQHPERFDVPDEVEARQIFFACEQPTNEEIAVKQKQLEAYRTQILDGADMAVLAREHSDCPENGGFMGCITRGQMTDPFEKHVFEIKEGELSKVFQTPFGFHLVRVEKKIGVQRLTFQQAKPVIQQILLQQVKHNRYIELLNRLHRNASIIIENG